MRRVSAASLSPCLFQLRALSISVEVIQLSNKDLINAGFLGDGESLSHCARLSSLIVPLVGAFESVKLTIQTTRANPELLAGESLSFFPRLSYLPLCV